MEFLAKTTYRVTSNDLTALGGISALAGVGMTIITIASILSLAVSVLMVISMWKIFKKAGKEGWAAIIPIYNTIVMIQITELPMWYIALFFVPFANIYASFKINIELAKKFGKSTGFGVAMVFFPVICMPILAFSKDAVYNGGYYAGAAASNTAYNPGMMNNQAPNYYGQPMQQPMQPQQYGQQPVQPQQQTSYDQPMQPQQPQQPMDNNGGFQNPTSL